MSTNIEKIQVLFLAEELRVGGAETYFYRLEEAVDRNRISFYTMAVSSGNESFLSHPELFVPYSHSFLNRVKVVSKFIQENEINIVHANSLQLCFVAAAIKLAKKLPYKIVYTKHNLTRLEKIRPRLLSCFVNRFVDVLVAICKTDEQNLIDIGVDRHSIVRINNSVDLKFYQFVQRFPLVPNRGLRVGILARLSPEKRHDLFLDIAKLFHEVYKDAFFYIGGEGPEHRKIAQIIEEENLGSYVNMLGKVDPSLFLREIDILMLVSDREVMPMSILEGMASGCAVIARSVGGVKDVVNTDTGILVNSDAPESYVNALGIVSRSNSFRDITENARLLVEDDYSLTNSIEKHMDLYLNLSDCDGDR